MLHHWIIKDSQGDSLYTLPSGAPYRYGTKEDAQADIDDLVATQWCEVAHGIRTEDECDDPSEFDVEMIIED